MGCSGRSVLVCRIEAGCTGAIEMGLPGRMGQAFGGVAGAVGGVAASAAKAAGPLGTPLLVGSLKLGNCQALSCPREALSCPAAPCKPWLVKCRGLLARMPAKAMQQSHF